MARTCMRGSKALLSLQLWIQRVLAVLNVQNLFDDEPQVSLVLWLLDSESL